MKNTDITKIYVGDTQGEKLYLGDELIWPVGGPTPTGDTRLAITYNVVSTTGTKITDAYGSALSCFSKAELGDGTVIDIKSNYFNGNHSFSETGLTTVYYTMSGTVINDRVFQSCTSITDVVIPEGVAVIGNQTFYNCTSITSVTLSDTVIALNNGCFQSNTSLPSVTIPSSVTTFNKFAFNKASGMTEMIFEGTTPPTFTPIGDDPVVGVGSYPIYVPCESVEAYKTAVGSTFASRITCVPEPSQYEILSSLTADGTFQIPVDIPDDYLTSGTAYEYRFKPTNTSNNYSNIFVGDVFGVGTIRILRGNATGKSLAYGDWTTRTTSMNPDSSTTVSCFKTATEVILGSEESESYYTKIANLTATTAQDTSTPRFFPTERVAGKYAAQGVFYYLKLGVSGAWDDDNLTAHFVPARDTSNNTLGVLDLVSNTFFPEIPNS